MFEAAADELRGGFVALARARRADAELLLARRRSVRRVLRYDLQPAEFMRRGA
jgi:hypothetical protein